jgi:hypothetical protein
MRIDHVVYATADLEGTTARLAQELGLEPTGGGRHDGLGTENRIIALGGGYLEVIAVADRDEAAASFIGAPLAARLERTGEGLWTWAVAVDDVAPIAARLGSGVMTVTRQGLSAHVTGVDGALVSGLPFFIARDHGIPDPGETAAAGGITWIEVAADAARLDDWLGPHDMPVCTVAGDEGVTGVGIGTGELR